MRDRYTPIPRYFGIAAMIATLFCLALGGVRADVVGRLHFSVKNADDEKPLANAKITLKDSANVRPDVTLTTDAQGSATSPPLETRAWQVTTNAEKPDTFQPDTRTVTVVADTTTEVEVLLEPLKEKVIKITGQKALVSKNQTSNATRIDQSILLPQSQKYPVNAGNPQSLSNIIRSTPGAAADSVNQIHPRGEHSSTSIFINGFELPGALQGRAGQLLTPETIQSLDIQTGGFAPEYGGETAAILNVNLRSGPIVPFASYFLEGGEYSTFDGELTLGGQAGRPIGAPDANGHVARRFGYFLDISGRATDNALEPPQPDNQTAHNHGESQSYFGNFDLNLGSRDQLTLTANSTPAFTQIANRAGLPASFAPVGQGFGYTGHLSAADAAAMGIASQEADGQDIYQRDDNTFGVLNWRHTFGTQLTGLLSFGLTHSGQDILNGNPAVNLTALPADNSIEFNPTIVRNYHHVQTQGSLTYNVKAHTVKGGLLFDDQEGDESYQLIPASQLALDALAALAPNLAPAGTPQVDAAGKPVNDALGNQVYQIDKNNPSVPIIHVHRSGFYRAGYIQDTWNISRRATLNYGIRVDWYKQSQNLGQPIVDQINVSPRINFAYGVDKRTVGRLSYNRLFIQPPLAQGAIIGLPISPETLDQYDGSVERQIAPGQTVKVAYYYKDIRNQIDTGLLIPGTQIGAFSSVNFDKGAVHGLEFSYYLTPRNNVGVSAYLTYTNSIAKPNGLDNTGAPAPDYNDHDQLNTINFGLAYTWRSGANLGMNLYHGSGVASSDIFGMGQRQPRTEVDLSLSTGPRLFGGKDRGGVQLNIENLFDDRSVINFNSGFSGTRFVQGRRILLAVFGKF